MKNKRLNTKKLRYVFYILLTAGFMLVIGYYVGLNNRIFPEVDSDGIQGFGYNNYLHESFIRKDSIKVNNCWCYIHLIYDKDKQITLSVEKKWWRDGKACR